MSHFKKITLSFVSLLTSLYAQDQVYGWLENVSLCESPYHMTAKLDSGAKTSSLHAPDKTIYQDPKGRTWVKFSTKGILHRNGKKITKRTTLKKPVHRTVTIKSSNGEAEERVSIILPMEIGNKILDVEFTLSDRTKMKYPILLGRTTISKLGLIDCSSTFKVQHPSQ